MSGMDAANWASKVIERWGFPMLVALAAGWVLRHDVLLPLVDAHTRFLGELSTTQREIVQTMQEQTRLLYALQPRTAAYRATDDAPQN
jgi:hypothetical protein